MPGEKEMMEHTKGPLIVRHGVDGNYHVDAPDGHAGFATCWGKDDIARANATLYAASPDILEALVNLFALVQGECPSLLENDHHYEMCQAAISAATRTS